MTLESERMGKQRFGGGVEMQSLLKESFERGMEIHSRISIFAEGCHGSLTKELCDTFNLRKHSQHQTYGIGIKEVCLVSGGG